jgi:hypothetical protein
MGLFNSSKACLSLNSPLVYEFLFTLWLPTLVISAVSILLIIVVTVILVYLHLKSGDIVWNSEKDRGLGTIAAIIAVLLCLYATVIHVISFISLANGVLITESNGIVVCALLLNIYFIIHPMITLC